jgi:hypothetical protein
MKYVIISKVVGIYSITFSLFVLTAVTFLETRMQIMEHQATKRV